MHDRSHQAVRGVRSFMASFSVSCPKSWAGVSCGLQQPSSPQQSMVSYSLSSRPGPLVLAGSSLGQLSLARLQKKEALPQLSATTPVVMLQPPSPRPMLPSQLPQVHAATAPSSSGPPAPAPATTPVLPAPAKLSNSSHPPLKCPMAGTFYRCPAPGEPPFVKVGGKVQKGQVICIIEPVKLMNEIEADQSGTVIEMLVEDGKPVSVDMPLFIIEPRKR